MNPIVKIALDVANTATAPTPKPFFPDGKAIGKLPDLSAKGMPDASWNKANGQVTTFDADKGLQRTPGFSFKRNELIEPYYTSTGGMDAAIEAARKAPTGDSVVATTERAFGIPQKPNYARLHEAQDVVLDTNNYRTAFYRPWNDQIHVGVGSRRGIPDLARKYILGEHIPADINHYSKNKELTVPHQPGSQDFADTLLHETNHATQRDLFPAEHPYTRTLHIGGQGYFANPREESQGMVRAKQETAALTGRRVDTPEDYSQLLKEVNPADPDEKAFEQRIQHYSPEGQRYWRYLRFNKDNSQYYQDALKRGAERMPSMVQNNPQQQNTLVG